MSDQKPLLRWTVGNVKDPGFETLAASVRHVRRLYGAEFDYVICHNGLTDRHLEKVRRLGEPLFDQRVYFETGEGLHLEPDGPAWKLYPTRLRLDRHEIVIDNDLVLYRRLPELEEFLASEKPLVTQAVKDSYDRFSLHIREGFEINTGLLGFPPGFDLKPRIESLPFLDQWHRHFDEQACVAAVLQHEDIILVPLGHVSVPRPNRPYMHGLHGVHFVGVNKGGVFHWRHAKHWL